MNRAEARAYFENNPGLFIGTVLQRDGSGKGFICPVCKAGTGERGTGLIVLRDGKHFKCWKSCFNDKAANILDVIGKTYNLTSFKDIMDKAAEITGITLEGYKAEDKAPLRPRAQQTEPNIAAFVSPQQQSKEKEKKPSKDLAQTFTIFHRYIHRTDYWKQRGLSLETVNRFNIGYYEGFDVNGEAWNALIVPLGKYGFLVRNTDPNATKSGDKDRRSRERGTPTKLYNPLEIEPSTAAEPVFIVEGEIDALSIIQCGGKAIALRGTGNAGHFTQQLLQSRPMKPKLLYLMLDGDAAGREATKEIRAALKGSFYLSFDLNMSRTDYNDPNEVLQHEPDELKRLIGILNRDAERNKQTLLQDQRKGIY